jgi:hypothetical protein
MYPGFGMRTKFLRSLKINSMKSLPAKKTYLLIQLFSVSLTLSAQHDWSKIELGANAITFIYQGDLTPSKSGRLKRLG